MSIAGEQLCYGVWVNSRQAVVTASCPHTTAAAGSMSGILNVRRARAGAQDGRVFHPQHKLAQGRDVAEGEAEGQGCRETLGKFSHLPWENEAFRSRGVLTQNGEENSELLCD